MRSLIVTLIATFSAATVLTASDNPQPMAVVSANAPIFSDAALSATVIRVAAAGSLLRVVKQDVEWVEIEFNDPQTGSRHGWMQRSVLNLSIEGLEPMDLSLARPTSPARRTATGPTPPCLIIKIYQKKAADAWTRWTVPEPFNYVEGDVPTGIKFRNELDDNNVREIKARGGHVVVLKSDYGLPDLVDARESCRTWQDTAR